MHREHGLAMEMWVRGEEEGRTAVGAAGDDPAASGEPPVARRTWAYVLAFWTGVGLMESAQSYLLARLQGQPRGVPDVLVANLPWWYVWALLTPLVFALARRVPLARPRLMRGVAVHAAASPLAAAAHLVLGGSLYWLTTVRVAFPGRPLGEVLASQLGGYLVMDVVVYWAVLGGFTALEYQRRLHEREREAARLAVRAARLEASVTEARLSALRMELNPHFLFNTLNSISGLVRRRENDAAVGMLATLGELLRATLGHTQPEVPLEQELDFVARYLEIERMRFHDRLAVEVDVPPELRHRAVPSLLLQPLVENAVRHGGARQPGPGRVVIRARARGGRLVLEVSDTGPGFQGAAREGGVGLANTRERLARLYGGRASLTLENAPGGGARVTVTLPAAAGADEEERGDAAAD